MAWPLLLAAALWLFAAAAQAQPFNPDPTEKWKSPDWMPGGKAAIVTPELRDGRVYKLTPAQIIYYSAKENGINPLLLLVKIQAEQSLLKQTFDSATLAHKLNRVVGYGIPETDIFKEKWPGFYPQLVGMSYEFSTMARKKDFHAAFLEYTPHEDKYVELVNFYQEYAAVMNGLAGKRYPLLPQSAGYLGDFRDITADHIQAFLDNYGGPLKNKKLFDGSASAPVSPAPISLAPNFEAAAYKASTNPLVAAGYGGQCTAFAWGRTLEVTGKRMDSTRNAKLWWEDTKYPKGSIAKPFSIAVWSSTTYGHVAFVEQVKANGNVVINEANWNTANQTKYGGGYDGAPKEFTATAIRTRGSASLLGYIYIADSSEMPAQDPNTVAQPVSREKFVAGLLKAFPSMPSQDALSIEQSARSLGLIVGGLNGNANIVRGDAAKIVLRLIQATDKAIPANPDPNHYANDTELDADPEARTAANALLAAGIASGEVHQARDMGFEFHPRRQLAVNESDLVQSRTLQFLAGSWLRSAGTVTITKAQASSSTVQGQLATFELTGTSLSAATPPRVSLAGCDGPNLTVLSTTSARFTCTPRVVGQARLFWKLPGTDNREFELGQFNVQGASADAMAFVSDAPPDDSPFDGGARFTKTWQLKNTGTTPWTSAWCLRPQDGAALGTAAVCVNGTVAPGAAYNFSVPMTVPAAQAGPVSLRQNWRLENAARAQVGPTVFVTVRVNAANTSTPVLTPTAPARVEVGKPWTLVVDSSAPTGAVVVQFAGEAATRLPTTDNRRFTLSRTFASVGVQTYSLQASFPNLPPQTLQGSVQVDAAPPPPPPPPPQALNPTLSSSNVVMAMQPWSATLRTNAPIDRADLVFKTGKRIPFDGGPTQWATRDENSRFTDAGFYEYELQLRRTASSPLEVFAGGTLEVRALQVPANPPRITSPASVGQGQPYTLAVQTSLQADKVTVRWPDQSGEQSLQPLDAARTQWQFSSRLFPTAGVVAYSVRSYKDGVTQPTGEVQGSLQVTVPNASMRLLGITKNIVKGEQPTFTVETSLSVARVAVQLGTQPAVALQSTGTSGAVQGFLGKVRVAEAGTVPYVITGYDIQGQAAGTPITGTVQVADVGDALTKPNPVPAEVQRGIPVSWQFVTAQAPLEMWAEISAPIGTLPLTGNYLNQTFTAPAGVYTYRIMRRDQYGNVYPIQGAAGSFRLKDATPVAVRAVSATPASGKLGQPMQFSVVLNQAAAVQRADLVFPDVNLTEPLAQTAPDTWSRSRTMAQAGSNRPFRVVVTLADGSRLQQDGTYSVADLPPPPTAQVQVGPNPGQVGQPVQFVVQLSSAQDVARLDWVFPSSGQMQVMQTVPMQQTGPTTWVLSQAFASPGSRNSQLRVTMTDGRTAVLGSATVTTLAPAVPPVVRADPAAVRAGQTMTFAAQVADPSSVARAEVVFTDANVVEPMVQTAANVWSRTRTMVQAGTNRPFIVRLLLKSGATVQAGGTYSVTP